MFDKCLIRAVHLLRIVALAMLALTGFRAAEFLRTASETVAGLPGVVREELAATRSQAIGELRTSRSELLARADRVAGSVESGIRAVERDVAALRERSTEEVASLNRTTSAELRATGASIRALTETYAAIPGDFKFATSQIWDCEANPDCLENRYVTLSRAVERASRAVEHSAPLIASSVERAVVNSDRTAAESAVLMKNLARSFKPLPWWLRIPLQVAVPAAQLATPLVIR